MIYLVGALLLLITGLIGAVLHIQDNLTAMGDVVIERFIRGAPLLAPSCSRTWPSLPCWPHSIPARSLSSSGVVWWTSSSVRRRPRADPWALSVARSVSADEALPSRCGSMRRCFAPSKRHLDHQQSHRQRKDARMTGLSRRRLIAVMVGVGLGMLLAALDQTIVVYRYAQSGRAPRAASNSTRGSSRPTCSPPRRHGAHLRQALRSVWPQTVLHVRAWWSSWPGRY